MDLVISKSESHVGTREPFDLLAKRLFFLTGLRLYGMFYMIIHTFHTNHTLAIQRLNDEEKDD